MLKEQYFPETEISITGKRLETEALTGKTDLSGKYTAELLPGTYQVEMRKGN